MGPAASRFPPLPSGPAGRDVLPPRSPRAHAPCAVSPGFPQEAGCGPGLPSPRATSRRSLTPPAPRILRALPVQVADTWPRPRLPLGHPAPTQALALTEGWAAGLRGGEAGAGRAIPGGPRGPRHPRSEKRTKGVTQRGQRASESPQRGEGGGAQKPQCPRGRSVPPRRPHAAVRSQRALAPSVPAVREAPDRPSRAEAGPAPVAVTRAPGPR